VFYYSAYNLKISSQIELPLLPSAVGGDVDILVLPREPRAGPPPGMRKAFHLTPRLATLDYAVLGTLRVQEGRRVTVILHPDACASALPYYLATEVMAVLLYQRGLLVLEACAVAIDGGAVVFLASPGGSKSDLIATLRQAGYPLLAEEIAVIDTRRELPVLIPSSSLLTLDCERSRHEERSPDAGLPQSSTGVKDFVNGHAAMPLPLRVVYHFRTGIDNTINYIPPQAGLAAVTYCSYPPCLLQPGGIDHLHQCGRLVGRVPVCELIWHQNSDDLPKLVEVVAGHMAALRR